MDQTSADQRAERGIRRWIAHSTAWIAAALLATSPFATAEPRPIVKDPDAAEPADELAIPKARVVSLPKTHSLSSKSSKKGTPTTANTKTPEDSAKTKPATKTRPGDEHWFAAAASFDPVPEIAVSLTIQIRKSAITAESAKGLPVLILGDSLSLCGFGQRLDSRFRKSPQFKGVFTYMTCGTVPLSWLKAGGYTNAKSCCGFFTIESDEDGGPIIVDDTYGNKRGSKPKAHPVPKVEDLLGRTEPDIVDRGCDGVEVRVERQGGSNGRVYTLGWRATDDAGHSVEGVCEVQVVHDQRGRAPVRDAEAYRLTLGADALDCPGAAVDAGVGPPVDGGSATPTDAATRRAAPSRPAPRRPGTRRRATTATTPSRRSTLARSSTATATTMTATASSTRARRPTPLGTSTSTAMASASITVRPRRRPPGGRGWCWPPMCTWPRRRCWRPAGPVLRPGSQPTARRSGGCRGACGAGAFAGSIGCCR